MGFGFGSIHVLLTDMNLARGGNISIEIEMFVWCHGRRLYSFENK